MMRWYLVSTDPEDPYLRLDVTEHSPAERDRIAQRWQAVFGHQPKLVEEDW